MTTTPTCDACTAPYLAWQLELTCVLWRCPRCGYIRRDLDLARANARADEYGGSVRADAVRTFLTDQRIRRRLGPRLAGRVLEIGCGDGSLARRLASLASDVVAIDPHAVSGRRDGVTFVCAAAGRSFDIEGGPFDVVIAIHVLEHVPDLIETLSTVHRLLRPGGVLYAITPNADSAGLRVWGEAWWMLEDPTHVRFLSAASVPFLAAATGFTDSHATPLRTDSLMVEAASTVRMRRSRSRGEAAETSSAVAALSVATLPLTLGLRTVRPRWCPSIEVVMTRDDSRPR